MEYLLGFFLFCVMVSMSAMDAASALLSIYFLFNLKKIKNIKPNLRLFNFVGFDAIFIVWLLVISLGFLVNDSQFAFYLNRILEFKWILFFYLLTAVLIFLSPTANVIKKSLGAIIFVSAYAIFVSIAGFNFVKGDRLMQVGDNLVRTGGFYANPMTLAHCYAFILCFIFGVLVYAYKNNEPIKNWLLIGLFFCGGAVLLTFTRGAWLSVLISFAVMLLIFKRKYMIMFLSAVLVTFVLFYSLWPAFKERIDYSFIPNESSQMRWNLWNANIDIFKDHKLLGAGYGQNVKLLPEYYDKLNIHDEKMRMLSHAHNQFIHFLAGTGILGLIVFLTINGLFLLLNWRVFKKISNENFWHKGLCLGAIGAQIGFLIGGIFEANFEHSKVKYMLTITWAIVTWLAYEYRVLNWNRKQSAGLK